MNRIIMKFLCLIALTFSSISIADPYTEIKATIGNISYQLTVTDTFKAVYTPDSINWAQATRLKPHMDEIYQAAFAGMLKDSNSPDLTSWAQATRLKPHMDGIFRNEN